MGTQTIQNPVFGDDDMAENYYLFPRYIGSSTFLEYERIGYSRADTLVRLVHNAAFDNTALATLHLADDSTDYQNTTGGTVYAIISVQAITNSGDRAYKIYSAPTAGSLASATEVYDSADWITSPNSFDASGEIVTSALVPIQDNHYIIVENTSGAASRNLRLTNSNEQNALVVEPAATP